MKKNKVVALGLDGASWGTLAPLLTQGHLPNIRRMINGGVSAPLLSSIPPVTCPGWRCYSTSKNPGQLGVFWWTGWDRDNGRLTFPCADSFHSLDFWDYLGAKDCRVAIINMPTTYPPKAVNGVMVSGFGAPLNRNLVPLFERVTYPDDWWPTLCEQYNYRIAMSRVDMGDKSQVVAEITDLIKIRFKLLFDLLDSGKYDFLHLTIFYINTLQHFYGTDEVVANAWKLIDQFIGRLLDTGCYLFIFSDHGMMKIERSFLINNWLIEGGYLKLKRDAGDIINLLDTFGQRNLGWRERYLSDWAKQVLPVRLQDKMPGLHQLLKTNMIDQKIDWAASSAISLSQGVIYINRQQAGADYEKVRDELRHKLLSLKSPEDGKRVVDEVYTSDELYKGDYVNDAPDLVAMPADGFEMYGGIGGQAPFFHGCGDVFQTRERAWSSGNHPEGIFIAHGGGIAGKKLEQASLLDIAPTIMHLMDVPVAEDMEGRVLQDIFKPDSVLATKEIKYQPALKQLIKPAISTENKQLKETLTDLGYLE